MNSLHPIKILNSFVAQFKACSFESLSIGFLAILKATSTQKFVSTILLPSLVSSYLDVSIHKADIWCFASAWALGEETITLHVSLATHWLFSSALSFQAATKCASLVGPLNPSAMMFVPWSQVTVDYASQATSQIKSLLLSVVGVGYFVLVTGKSTDTYILI